MEVNVKKRLTLVSNWEFLKRDVDGKVAELIKDKEETGSVRWTKVLLSFLALSCIQIKWIFKPCYNKNRTTWIELFT